jgi:hypothetical protein
MGVNTPLAKARDSVSPHQGWDLRRRDVQEFAEQRGIHQNIAISDLDLHDALISPSDDPAVRSSDARSRLVGRSPGTIPMRLPRQRPIQSGFSTMTRLPVGLTMRPDGTAGTGLHVLGHVGPLVKVL